MNHVRRILNHKTETNTLWMSAITVALIYSGLAYYPRNFIEGAAVGFFGWGAWEVWRRHRDQKAAT